MKAIIEKWYFHSAPQKILNRYLLRIVEDSVDTESLRSEIADLESELRRNQITNPFHSGFAEDGFGVYNIKGERVIFVECEVDIEL